MNIVAVLGMIALAFAFYIVGMHFGAVKRILFIPVLLILGGWLMYYYSFHRAVGTQYYTYAAVFLWLIGVLWCLIYLGKERK